MLDSEWSSMIAVLSGVGTLSAGVVAVLVGLAAIGFGGRFRGPAWLWALAGALAVMIGGAAIAWSPTEAVVKLQDRWLQAALSVTALVAAGLLFQRRRGWLKAAPVQIKHVAPPVETPEPEATPPDMPPLPTEDEQSPPPAPAQSPAPQPALAPTPQSQPAQVAAEAAASPTVTILTSSPAAVTPEVSATPDLAQLIKKLLAATADHPLHEAVRRQRPALVALLVSKGADVNAPEGRLGARPLHLARATGNAEIVSFLLLRGGDPNATDRAGNTPDDWAKAIGTSDKRRAG